MKLLISFLPMPSANKGYPVTIPIGCARFTFQTRDGTACWFAATQEKASEGKEQMWTVRASGTWDESNLEITSPLTIWAACASTSKILEMLFWVLDGSERQEA